MKPVTIRLKDEVIEAIHMSGINMAKFIRMAIDEKLCNSNEDVRKEIKKVEESIKKLKGYTTNPITDPIAFLRSRYQGQCSSSRRRGMDQPMYTQDEFVDKFKNDRKFLKMYRKYIKSGGAQELVPSFNRLDETKTYSFDNIELLTWGDHRRLSSKTTYAKRVKIDGKTYDTMTKAMEEEFSSSSIGILSAALKKGDKYLYGKRIEYA